MSSDVIQQNEELKKTIIKKKKSETPAKSKDAPKKSNSLLNSISLMMNQNKKEHKWELDKGLYYKTKTEAQTRRNKLLKKYGDVEIFQRKDNNWQCKFKKTPPKKEEPKESGGTAPQKLDLFTSGLKDFTVQEVNDLLYTTFGEMSPSIYGKEDIAKKEAHAIVSTVLNRYSLITESRANNVKAKTILAEKQSAHNEALEYYEEYSRQQSNNIKKIRKEYPDKDRTFCENIFKENCKKAHKAYKNALRARTAAQREKVKAYSAEIRAESYMGKNRKSESVSITLLVNDPHQFEGYPTGKNYYDTYTTMNNADKKRNAKRWEIAKSVIKAAIADSKTLDKFLQFRSNRNGKRPLKKTETRIGGNDFWVE